MLKTVKEAITDERNQQDILLWLLVGGVIAFIGLGYCSLFVAKTVDIGSFGTGLAAILGLGGFGYGAKRLGEKYGDSPPCDPK